MIRTKRSPWVRLLAAAACIAAPVCTAFAAEAPKPNVLILVADDLGYADIGAQRVSADVVTPNIDSIAKNGVRFTNGYVSAPVCSPSRAGFLTGRYQERFGHEHNPVAGYDDKFGVPTDQITMADEFKRLGYATGALGKWHLGSRDGCRPLSRGFDEYFGFLGGMHGYRGKGEGNNAIRRGDTPVDQPDYLTDAISSEAVSFIDHHKDKPFFLYVAYNAVHVPQMAPPKYQNRFPNVKDPKRKLMLAMLAAEDDGIGLIMDKLRSEKLEQNTLVVFFSDNGGPTAGNASRNAPLRGFKGQLWEGGIRIPYMVQWKGTIPPGQLLDDPVISLDVFPTALAAADVTPRLELKLDGVNLLPRLKGESKTPVARALYWRFTPQWAIRDGNYKLVSALHSEPQLFDLSKDPSESNNLMVSHLEIAVQLREKYEEWNGQLVAPLWPGRQEGENQADAALPTTRKTAKP